MKVSGQKISGFGGMLYGVVPLDGAQRKRLQHAVRTDNRGHWFLCKSRWMVEQLQQKFATEQVATVLFERVGGMLQIGKNKIAMQILLVETKYQQLHPDSEPEQIEVPTDGGMPDDMVQAALQDIHVSILAWIPDIVSLIKQGRY